METNPIDSIARQVAPDGQFDNVYWWIGIILLFVQGVAAFVFKHYAKGKILDKTPKPRLGINGEKGISDSITFSKVQMVDVQQKVVNQTEQQMAALRVKYQEEELNVYNNMNLVFQSNFNVASNWNADVQSYLEGMEEYYRHTVEDQVMSSFLKPVVLVLYAKGNKACSNLMITLSCDGNTSHLYDLSSKVRKEGKHDIPPEEEKDDRGSQFYAFFPNEQKSYQYTQWDLKPISLLSNYECDILVSGTPKSNIIPGFLIDTRYSQSFSIKWKINGRDISEKGIQGTLYIQVVD